MRVRNKYISFQVPFAVEAFLVLLLILASFWAVGLSMYYPIKAANERSAAKSCSDFVALDYRDGSAPARCVDEYKNYKDVEIFTPPYYQ